MRHLSLSHGQNLAQKPPRVSDCRTSCNTKSLKNSKFAIRSHSIAIPSHSSDCNTKSLKNSKDADLRPLSLKQIRRILQSCRTFAMWYPVRWRCWHWRSTPITFMSIRDSKWMGVRPQRFLCFPRTYEHNWNFRALSKMLITAVRLFFQYCSCMPSCTVKHFEHFVD